MMTVPHVPSQELKVESKKYNIEKDEDNRCVICYEAYESEDMVTLLPCNHLYHTTCIKNWGTYKAECPTCRAAIPIDR